MAKHEAATSGNAGSAGNGALGAADIRDRIASKQGKTRREIVHVASWGVDIEVRGIMLGQRSKLMDAAYDSIQDPETGERRDKINYERYYPILFMATCFAPGTDDRVFLPDDYALINSLDPADSDQISRVAARLSGLGTGTGKSEGNPSGGTASGGSDSTSRAPSA